jgi:hypothetical protein
MGRARSCSVALLVVRLHVVPLFVVRLLMVRLRVVRLRVVRLRVVRLRVVRLAGVLGRGFDGVLLVLRLAVGCLLCPCWARLSSCETAFAGEGPRLSTAVATCLVPPGERVGVPRAGARVGVPEVVTARRGAAW